MCVCVCSLPSVGLSGSELNRLPGRDAVCDGSLHWVSARAVVNSHPMVMASSLCRASAFVMNNGPRGEAFLEEHCVCNQAPPQLVQLSP